MLPEWWWIRRVINGWMVYHHPHMGLQGWYIHNLGNYRGFKHQNMVITRIWWGYNGYRIVGIDGGSQTRNRVLRRIPRRYDGYVFPTGWWFGTFFPYIGNNHPNWLILFRGVETTPSFGSVVHHPSWYGAINLGQLATTGYAVGAEMGNVVARAAFPTRMANGVDYHCRAVSWWTWYSVYSPFFKGSIIEGFEQ